MSIFLFFVGDKQKLDKNCGNKLANARSHKNMSFSPSHSLMLTYNEMRNNVDGCQVLRFQRLELFKIEYPKSFIFKLEKKEKQN